MALHEHLDEIEPEHLAIAGLVASPFVLDWANRNMDLSVGAAASPSQTINVGQGGTAGFTLDVKNRQSETMKVDAVVDLVRPDGSRLRHPEAEQDVMFTSGETSTFHYAGTNNEYTQWYNVSSGNLETAFNQDGSYDLVLQVYRHGNVSGRSGMPTTSGDPVTSLTLNGVFQVGDGSGGGGGGSDPTPASFSIDSLSTNSPITEGEFLNVDARITNTGDEQATKTAVLNVAGGDRDSASVTLAGGESQTVRLRTGFESGTAGTYTATVRTPDDSTSTSVTVEAPDDGGDDTFRDCFPFC